MLLALVTVGGFLTWLGMEAEPTSISVMEDTGEDAIIDPPDVTVVPKDTLAENKARYTAQQIRVHSVGITGQLGEKIYWGELGDGTTQLPILVRLDSASAAGDSISGPFAPEEGELYSIRGLVFPMSDSLAMAWGDQGEFAGEGEEMQAMFTDYYIQANDIQRTPESQRESMAPVQDASADSAATGEESEGAMSGDAGTR
jgi:hypothetical protein